MSILFELVRRSTLIKGVDRMINEIQELQTDIYRLKMELTENENFDFYDGYFSNIECLLASLERRVLY